MITACIILSDIKLFLWYVCTKVNHMAIRKMYCIVCFFFVCLFFTGDRFCKFHVLLAILYLQKSAHWLIQEHFDPNSCNLARAMLCYIVSAPRLNVKCQCFCQLQVFVSQYCNGMVITTQRNRMMDASLTDKAELVNQVQTFQKSYKA